MSTDSDEKALQDLRRNPRYAPDLPPAFSLGEVVASEAAYLNNISAGGVSFNSRVNLAPGTVIMLHLPETRPVFRARACRLVPENGSSIRGRRRIPERGQDIS